MKTKHWTYIRNIRQVKLSRGAHCQQSWCHWIASLSSSLARPNVENIISNKCRGHVQFFTYRRPTGMCRVIQSKNVECHCQDKDTWSRYSSPWGFHHGLPCPRCRMMPSERIGKMGSDESTQILVMSKARHLDSSKSNQLDRFMLFHFHVLLWNGVI